MKKTILFSLLISTPIVFAQLPESLITPIEKIKKFEGYDGYIYKNMSYKDSKVINEKIGTFSSKLKYNIYTDAIELSIDSQLYELKKTPETHVVIKNDYYYYCNFKDQLDRIKSGYYVLVELTNNYRIYKKYTLKIDDPEKSKIIKNSSSNAGTIKLIKTYYLEKNGIINILPTDKKTILITFSDKKKELEKYMKKEKIRLKKEEDLMKLVAKYNALKNMESRF
ncbi:hypothetical protein [Aquimarina sp. RZ0]|uniref:hypothetical protein n=1 Tax=Aquimarina sp. RZ0 TaxID=2607730 RepID=UPI0011F0AA8B|nr:hypothetical protein [Aquimarina sp. RZ0]KAA1243702.1 hypothetical protein F0000_19930 [Aquimarina sp. RZ0]